jgi:hypothetical protein
MLKTIPGGNGREWFKISRRMFRKSCTDFSLKMRVKARNRIRLFV